MAKNLYIILLFLQIMSLRAQSPETNAFEHFTTGDYLEAITDAETCFQEDTTNVSCIEILANSFNRLGDQAAAKTYYHKIEKIDSTNRNAFAQLASIYEQQQRIPRAIKYYTLLNKLDPENPIYFRKNAKLYKSVNDKKEAFRLYAKANKLNPKDVISLKGLAELCVENNQTLLADSLLRKGLRIDTDNVGLYYLFSRSKYKQKQHDSVTLILQKVAGKVDLNSYYNKLLGFSYLQIDSVDLAIQKLSMALVGEEQSEKLHFYLATAFEKKGEIKGALDHYEKAVKFGRSPDLDMYHRNTARIANNEKQYKKAISHYKDAYKYGNDPVVLYYLASICDIYYKDKSIAINYYKKYIKSKHRNKEYQAYAKNRSRYLKEIQHQSN
ncbi:MAG: tetratricopeptide repeat protein [Saprospiraceae bacterium]|nr:tetratricopeptide repeat protein [Saprospiraceae bacterium]